MNAYFLLQWQTREFYIGQAWTEDVHEANWILKEQHHKEHQSLQVFLVSKDCDIKELDIYYNQRRVK